jgi:hypothetical protein
MCVNIAKTTTKRGESMLDKKFSRFYDLWKFSEEEQRQLLGCDIGVEIETIVVELDEVSKRHFYNETFAPITINEYDSPYPTKTRVFQVIVHSIDDASVNMVWRVDKMQVEPYEARDMIKSWLNRTYYFVNLKGLESFCTLFGEFDVDYN